MREVRFTKFQMARWMNGDEHWLIMGKDYEPHESPHDIVRKLRNAAWYRATTLAVNVYPDRIWIRAREPGQGTHRPTPGHVSLDDRVQVLEANHQAMEDNYRAMEDKVKTLQADLDDFIINNS